MATVAASMARVARPELANTGGSPAAAAAAAAAFRAAYMDIVPAGSQWPAPGPAALPIVYHPRCNVSFFGLEKLHPFDAGKFGKVADALARAGVVASVAQLVRPTQPAPFDALADVHTRAYLEDLQRSSLRVAQVTELAPLAVLPAALLRWRVVTPMRYHAAGTMLAAALALSAGWAVHLGGGMHHAHAEAGGGWCMLDDIMLAVRRLARAVAAVGPEVTKPLTRVLVIDLDAHQGNGVARDKLRYAADPPQVVLLDAYHDGIYPSDAAALPGVDVRVPLRAGCGDTEYLAAVRAGLDTVAARWPAAAGDGFDLVVYNAGTDILDGDPLGGLGVSFEGVIARDRLVWEWARDVARAPLVMTLSGGYARDSARCIAASLTSLLLPQPGGNNHTSDGSSNPQQLVFFKPG